MMHLLLHRSRRAFAVVLAIVVAALAAGLLTRAARAQQAPVRFAYLVGKDTVGFETVTPGNGTVLGSLRYKGQPRVDWEQVREPLQLTMKVFAAGAAESATPMQSLVFRPSGDSVAIEVTANGRSTTQRVASKAGAVPVIPSSVLHMALLSQYARSIGKTTLPMFLTAGAQTMDVGIVFSGDTSIVTIAGLQLRTVWADGVPNESMIAAQNLRVVRTTGGVEPPSRAPETIDYRAPVGAPYVAEDVVIPTTRGYTLAGTLTTPKGIAKAPVVVTISGSGPQERDSRISLVPGYAIFRELADTLGRRGIAVLRYDDRGVGASGGRESAAVGTTATAADDVESVVAFLRARTDLDGARILLAGHSEGGVIAPMIAARDPKIRGIALLAGQAYQGRRVSLFQNRQILDDNKALTPHQRDSIMATIPKMLDSLGPASNPWTAFWLRYDPLPTARQVTQPVLILQGLTDSQVSPEQADTLATAMRRAGNRRVTVRSFPATNHLFLPDSSGAFSGYTSLKDVHVRREVLGALADWVVQVVK